MGPNTRIIGPFLVFFTKKSMKKPARKRCSGPAGSLTKYQIKSNEPYYVYWAFQSWTFGLTFLSSKGIGK